MLSITSRKLIHDKSDTAIKYRTRITKSPLKDLSPNDDNRKSASVLSTARTKYKISPNALIEKINDFSQPFYKFSHEIYEAKCKDLNILLVNEQEKRFFSVFQQNAENRKLNLSAQKLEYESSLVIAKILAKTDKFAYIDLSKNKLGDEGIKKIIRSALYNPHIVHLDISSNDISQSAISEILSMLSQQISIYSLDLSSHQFLYRNKIGACEKILNLLKSPTLAYLNLSGTNIGSEGLKYIILGLENNQTLIHLNLSSNSIKGNVIKELVQVLVTCKLNDLSLENNLLEETAADEFGFFFTGYYGYGALTKLNLGGNLIPTLGIYKVFEALIKENCLESLILDRNNFVGFLDVLDRFLIGNKRLKYLSLAFCNLKIEAFTRICEGLAENQFLETLVLAGNTCKDVGAKKIANALLKNNSLQTLDLSSNLIKSEGGISIAFALRNNKSLKNLILSDNELKDDVGENFYHAFGTNYTLLKVKFNLNPMSAKYMVDIQKYLERNKNYIQKNEIEKIITTTKEKLKRPLGSATVIKQKIIETQLEKDHIQNKIGGYAKRLQMIKTEEEKKLEEIKNIAKEHKEKSNNLSKTLYELQLEIKVIFT